MMLTEIEKRVIENKNTYLQPVIDKKLLNGEWVTEPEYFISNFNAKDFDISLCFNKFRLKPALRKLILTAIAHEEEKEFFKKWNVDI